VTSNISYRAEEQYWFLPNQRNLIFYDGPSRIDGARILGVATAQSQNRKIGKMLQLWIMPSISPIVAVKSGADASVCGDCALRGTNGAERICYVEWWRAVENIWQSAQKPHRTGRATIEEFAGYCRGLQLRLGAYGDPVAIPLDVWRPLLAVAGGWTAYTHQWSKPHLSDGYQDWCMASVETEQQQRDAEGLGWRTFRVRNVDAPMSAREVVCPHELNSAIKCAACSLCRGSARQAKSVVVTVHGRGGMKYLPLVREGA
jgi:hypothetical protein